MSFPKLSSYECAKLASALADMRRQNPQPSHRHLIRTELDRVVAFLVPSLTVRVTTQALAVSIYYIAVHAVCCGAKDMIEVRDRVAELAGISVVDRLADVSADGG